MGVLDSMGPSQSPVRKIESMATGSIEGISQEKLLERIMGEQKEPNRQGGNSEEHKEESIPTVLVRSPGRSHAAHYGGSCLKLEPRRK